MKTVLYLLPLAAALASLNAATPTANPCAMCPHNAKCVNNECVCEDGFQGDGKLLCVKKDDYHVCSIRSDPEMSTFGGQNVLVETFGSANFAEVSTGRRTGAGENGMCRFSSTAFTERVLGKIFAKGVTFELIQEDMLGQQIYLEVSVKAEVVDAGRYRYAISSRESHTAPLQHQAFISPTPYPGDEQTITITRDGCDVIFRLFQGNVLSINLACCGIRVGLRPHHPFYTEAIPGLYVQVKKIFSPHFPYWSAGAQPLCMSPDNNIEDLKSETGLNDIKAAITFHALTSPGKHVETTPDDQRHLANVLKYCPVNRLQMLYDFAGFIVESPPFINCISGNSEGQSNIVSLLLHSARYYCHGWRWACRCSVQMVLDRCQRLLNNPARYPRVAAFARQTCTDV